MQTGQLNIHSENILPIIKKWLYSERDIFLRELISNASDAIQKRQVLASRGESPSFEPKIDVKIDAASKTITISDNGIGMDAPEAEKYLSQIAFSGAEEFIKAYEVQDAFIGHFGLGFYSSYMVADRVEVHSRSYKPEEEGIIWKCDGGIDYSIEKASKKEIGTDVVLHITDEAAEFLQPHMVRGLLTKYCSFFPQPLYFEGVLINSIEPLWIKKSSDCTDVEYKSLYAHLFPFEEPPLFWIHLNVDYPFHVKGILYFPHMKELVENKKGVRLYCNRVFVSDDCSDILPNFLMMLKGVIDSPDIPLNVSRSHLQVDKTVKQLSNHIVKKVGDALVHLFKNDRSQYESVWPDLERVVKIGSLQDEQFFGRVQDIILWKASDGSWISSGELRLQSKDAVCMYAEPVQVNTSLLKSATDSGHKVVISSSPVDAALMMLYERSKEKLHFKRLDSQGADHLFDPAREKTLLDAEGKTFASHVADFFRKALPEGVDIQAKSLKEDAIPLLIQFEEQTRRVRDYLRHMQPEEAEQMKVHPTVLVNTNNSTIDAIYQLNSIDPKKASKLAKDLFDLQRLSQGELKDKEKRELFHELFFLIQEYATVNNRK